jgi:hypothetical protein
MYCPRCGSPNNDTTKFCRQCGLALTQVTGYVASGGTGSLTPPPAPTPKRPGGNPIGKLTEGMTPRQKKILAILCFVFLPGFFAVADIDFMVPIAGVVMILGIVWSSIYFKNQERRLANQQLWQSQQDLIRQMHQQAPTPAQPGALPHPALPISQPTQQQPRQPVYQPPMVPSPPPTNPLKGLGSVTEEETQRLPDRRD